jgi:PAS domain-containing protein
MARYLMTITWFCFLACFAAGYTFIIRTWQSERSPAPFIWLGAAGFLFWLYLTVRLYSFRRNLDRFFRHLLEGNYETGIKMSRFFQDEVHAAAGLANAAADRLRLYDSLRAEKVALNTRAREVMYSNMREAVMVADVEKRVFQLNPAARALFEIEQETMTFDSIRERQENAEFTRLCDETVESDRVLREERITITLPIRGISKEIAVKIIPVKDREERVKLALIFLK